MNKYKIVSDSSSNLLAFSPVPYAVVPLKIISREKEYIDDINLDVEAMVMELKDVKGVVKTSCPNICDWSDAYSDAENIFAITITSNLSGAYNSASLAKEDFLSTHPDVKIHVIDSFSTGGEMQLIIEKLSELIALDKPFEEIVSEIEEYKNHTHLQFCLQSLANLSRNGRVSPAVAALAGVLGIRIIGIAKEGILHPVNKVRGEKKALLTIFDNMKAYGYKGGKVRINHCMNDSSAQILKNHILSQFPSADVSIIPCSALCSFYAEQGGLILGYEDI